MKIENNTKNNKSIFSENKFSRRFHIFVYTVLFLIIIFLSFYFYRDFKCHNSYTFIKAGCEDPIIDKRNYIELKYSLENYFETEKREGRLFDISVYFRDLNAGPVMGINENSNYSSASLLKLPIIMSLLDMAEESPEILDVKLVYKNNNENNIEQFFKPDQGIQEGVDYSINEIIKYALMYSDNKAIFMLNNFIDANSNDHHSILQTFRELGLILPNELLDRDISTRAYSSLFRLLYNASYLNRDYSNMILDILSQSSFDKGLESGVPKDVKVAHKFGERFYDDIKQLHDCGIVYYPDNPYLLCIMTEGNDYENLEKIIREISRMVYEEVDSRKL